MSSGKKSTSSFTFCVRYHRYCQLVIFGTLSMPGYTHSKWYYQLEENFCLYLHTKKSTSFPTFFWRYCKGNANFLFSVLWACLAAHTKIDSISENDTTSLKENVNVYLHAKTNFHHSLLSWDIILKEYYNLIGQQHFGS